MARYYNFNDPFKNPNDNVNIGNALREYDEIVGQYASSKFDDLLLEHYIIQANVLIEHDKFRSHRDEEKVFRLKGKIGDFIRLMGEDYVPGNILFTISAFVDNAVKVEFKHKKGTFLTIYDNQASEDMESDEEAFLSFVDGEESRLEYGTLKAIVGFIKNKINNER